MLNQQDGFGKRTQVVRIMPGGEVPMHGHPNGEKVFLLEGALMIRWVVTRLGPGLETRLAASIP